MLLINQNPRQKKLTTFMNNGYLPSIARISTNKDLTVVKEIRVTGA
jgi:hypothetical protein